MIKLLSGYVRTLGITLQPYGKQFLLSNVLVYLKLYKKPLTSILERNTNLQQWPNLEASQTTLIQPAAGMGNNYVRRHADGRRDVLRSLWA